MNAIRGRYVQGKVILDSPADWPEGTEVNVHPADVYVGIGMREEDWPTTPAGIAALAARMDQVEPGWLNTEDEAAWRAALRAQRDRDKAESDQNADRLRRIWE